MKYFNYIFPLLVVFLAAASCRNNEVKPNTAAKPIDTDAFIHQINFTAPIQYSAGQLNNSTITFVYYENVTILIPKEGYTLSYALHLREDFSNSVLLSFQYTTVDAEGDVTTNWVDDNLNNITAKTVKDTTINNVAMVSVNVQRPFTFTKTYPNSNMASVALDSIAKLKTDKINFSSYLFFTKTYPATVTNSSILYVK